MENFSGYAHLATNAETLIETMMELQDRRLLKTLEKVVFYQECRTLRLQLPRQTGNSTLARNLGMRYRTLQLSSLPEGAHEGVMSCKKFLGDRMRGMQLPDYELVVIDDASFLSVEDATRVYERCLREFNLNPKLFVLLG